MYTFYSLTDSSLSVTDNRLAFRTPGRGYESVDTIFVACITQ